MPKGTDFVYKNGVKLSIRTHRVSMVLKEQRKEDKNSCKEEKKEEQKGYRQNRHTAGTAECNCVKLCILYILLCNV